MRHFQHGNYKWSETRSPSLRQPALLINWPVFRSAEPNGKQVSGTSCSCFLLLLALYSQWASGLTKLVLALAPRRPKHQDVKGKRGGTVPSLLDWMLGAQTLIDRGTFHRGMWKRWSGRRDGFTINELILELNVKEKEKKCHQMGLWNEVLIQWQ